MELYSTEQRATRHGKKQPESVLKAASQKVASRDEYKGKVEINLTPADSVYKPEAQDLTNVIER